MKMTENKKCKKCGIIKNINEFQKQDKYYSARCKPCLNEDKKVAYAKNRDVILKRNKTYRNNNKEAVLENKKLYYENNRDSIIEYKKEYRANNKDKVSASGKKYRNSHKEYFTLYYRVYYENNKEKVRSYQNSYYVNKIKNPEFRLRRNVSRLVAHALNANDSSKFNSSILKYLPYSIQDLKEHIEKRFESWMSWNNWGVYDHYAWNDNDSSTWTWQLDHIIPQSDLPYISMADDNFIKCWELSNLRPLSAKQNLLDGSTRIRHKNDD